MRERWEDLKSRRITVGAALGLCLLALATGITCCYAAFGWRTHAVQVKLREIDALVADKYVGEFNAERIADYAAYGYMTGVDDRWSSYIPAEQYEAYRLRGEGKSCGIGVSVISSADSIRIYLVYDGSPAQEAGLAKGDQITGAEGLTVEKDGTGAVLDAVQGEEGAEVQLTVRKAETGTEQQLTLTRAIVTQKMVWGELLTDNVGYLRIENFYDGSAAQFSDVLDRLIEQGAQKLVLDVRHDGGGRVREMSDMLDRLLPEGTIMRLETRDGQETVYESDADMVGLPLAVLMDDQSISAAEFFAAALQEYERATLVGVHTGGKGRAQRTYALSDGSALNLSVEQYYTPKGRSLAGAGIAPDVEAALSEEQKADFFFLTAGNDPQLQKALEILR